MSMTQTPQVVAPPPPAPAGAAAPPSDVDRWGFTLYLLFICSWFLHLTARLPALGIVRFDLSLILLIVALIFVTPRRAGELKREKTGAALGILVIYVLVTFPFVEWPGSVLQNGIPSFIKVVVFYYFSVHFVTTRRRLAVFMAVLLACQTFRVFEPVYLHLTTGYWGDKASMANWETLNRLAGAPYDTVNPNGLAFIVVSILPFFHFLAGARWVNAVVYALVAPVLLYALILTGSRSGMVGLAAILLWLFMKSHRKMLLAGMAVVACLVAAATMTDDMKDRYLSIVSSDTKNAQTAEGRLEGNIKDLKVGLRRPFFGHGLGTSAEANTHFQARGQPAHNLYLEVFQELGIFGLGIVLYFLYGIAANFNASIRNIKARFADDKFLHGVATAMQGWLWMNILFSFASYGLSSYHWYLFAGLSVVLAQLTAAPAGVKETR